MLIERNYKRGLREFHHPTGWFFTRKTRRNSREFFFWPFFSVLRVFAPHAPQTQRIPERYIATTSLWPPRVASETPRGAYASLKIRYAKFSRPKLAKASPEGKPRIQPTCHNFGPPALRSKRCVAPMLRQIFRSQKFRGATLEEEGSKGQPWKKKVPTASREWSQRRYHNFWPPESRAKRCVAPLFRENFRIPNFRGASGRKQVPKTNH